MYMEKKECGEDYPDDKSYISIRKLEDRCPSWDLRWISKNRRKLKIGEI